MEIVTWVLDGALEHRDSEGNDGVITPRRRAAHERGHAASGTRRRTRARPSRCTSCRCGSRPTRTGIAPGYEQRDVSDRHRRPTSCSRSRRAARPTPRSTIHQRDATLWVATPDAGRARRRARTRRSCTCSSRPGRATLDGAGRARRGRRGAPHRRRCARPHRRPPTAPRSPSGRCGPTSRSR